MEGAGVDAGGSGDADDVGTSCEPDPASESTAIEYVGERGGGSGNGGAAGLGLVVL